MLHILHLVGGLPALRFGCDAFFAFGLVVLGFFGSKLVLELLLPLTQ